MIKARKGWSIYSKPMKPLAPLKPSKVIITESGTEVLRKEVYQFSETLLSELIPGGGDPKNFSLQVSTEDSYGCTIIVLRVLSENSTERENPNYDKELVSYNEMLTKWNLQVQKYKEELKEWKLWVEQEKQIDLEKKIKSAKDLLKKHKEKYPWL